MAVMKRTLPVLLACFLVTAARAEGPFTWNWSAGDSVRQVMNQKMEMGVDAGAGGAINVTTDQQLVMTLRVESVRPDGAAVISQGVERAVLRTEGAGGQSFRYDSADENPPIGMAALVAPMYDAMVENDFKITMLPTGEISDVELPEKLAEAFKRLPGGMFSADTLAQLAKQGGIAFPTETIAPGHTWTRLSEATMQPLGKITTTTTYTYTGSERVGGRELEAIDMRVEVAMPASQSDNPTLPKMEYTNQQSSGKVLFDAQTSRVVSSDLRHQFDLEVTVGDAQRATTSVDQTVTLRELSADERVDWEHLTAPAEEEAETAEAAAD